MFVLFSQRNWAELVRVDPPWLFAVPPVPLVLRTTARKVIVIVSVPALFPFVLLVIVPKLNVTSRPPLATVVFAGVAPAVGSPPVNVSPDVAVADSTSTNARPRSSWSKKTAFGVTPSGTVTLIVYVTNSPMTAWFGPLFPVSVTSVPTRVLVWSGRAIRTLALSVGSVAPGTTVGSVRSGPPSELE